MRVMRIRWALVCRPAHLLVLLTLLVLAPAWAASADPPTLAQLVAEKAGAVELLHRKAEKNLVTAAQDPVFTTYFSAKSDEERLALKGRIEQITLRVQSRFGVDEMCLIDPRGWEISRIVQGQVAQNLSTTESNNLFFKPAFATAPRTVFTTRTYVSPDTSRWVVGYATPIVSGGAKQAILHYEQPLDTFQTAVTTGIEPAGRTVMLVDSEGWVIADSRRVIPIEAGQDTFDPASSFSQFAWHGLDLAGLRKLVGVGDDGAGEAVTDGATVRAAFRQVRDWTVVGIDGG
jgi:hypothetical protein